MSHFARNGFVIFSIDSAMARFAGASGSPALSDSDVRAARSEISSAPAIWFPE